MQLIFSRFTEFAIDRAVNKFTPNLIVICHYLLMKTGPNLRLNSISAQTAKITWYAVCLQCYSNQ